MTSTTSEAETYQIADGMEYTPHSMMHKAIVRMNPTKLEMLDGFKRTDAGHKFVPEDSNVRVIVSGRDWSEKRVLIYGSKSSEEAREHVETIIKRVTAVDHDAELQTLANERDVVADFHGALANFNDDLSSRSLGGGMGMIKKLTAGDPVRACDLYESGSTSRRRGNTSTRRTKCPT